jgi:predicted nucleic acid-binding protein
MYLLDTNVASDARRPNGNPHVKAWLLSVRQTEQYLSALLVGEVRRGVERIRRRDPLQAAVLETWLVELRRDFADRIIPVTADIAEEWGRLNVPDPLPPIDGLLAATARVQGLILVTRNTADFERTGVRLLNPFEPR